MTPSKRPITPLGVMTRSLGTTALGVVAVMVAVAMVLRLSFCGGVCQSLRAD